MSQLTLKTFSAWGLIIVCHFLILPIAIADGSSQLKTEISHLLSYVENSQCQFVRNGETYRGKEAAGHIRKKYDYYKDKIRTSEKFIELSATKSVMSGKYYQVICDKRTTRLGDWLNAELIRSRKR